MLPFALLPVASYSSWELQKCQRLDRSGTTKERGRFYKIIWSQALENLNLRARKDLRKCPHMVQPSAKKKNC